ncbi:MAG: efflux RND transporter permease subunit, partial [Chitinivibrionia bacterium]|nr:efflux RND transporter permease subunit [Chitinivibrionia bacterium]
MKLYELSVKRPVLVSISLVTLLVLGGISVYKLPLEFFPQMDFPFIGVFIPYPNSLPSHVEKKISKPVEEVMGTLGDVRYIFSNSTSDGGFVGVVFNWGRDVNVLRMEVKEKVDQIRNELPSDVERVQIFTFNTNDAPIMVGRISAKGKDLSGSYDLLERAVLNPLRRIEGVGQVEINGVESKEIIVYLELNKLKTHRVDIGSIFSLLQSTNSTASIGEITSEGYRYHIRALGSFSSLEQIENLAINREGLRIKDIATVYYGEPEIEYGRHLDRDKAIAFEIKKSTGTNTVEVARNVKEALKKINANPALEGVNVLLFWDQSDQILNSLNGLKQSGLIGSIFAIVILYLFLRRLSTTMIIAVAIPFSVLCTCSFLYFSGRSLNLMTMMGLMLGVGMLVDNAIVVLESIFRHQSKGEESVRATIFGCGEVATAVIASTLTSVIVFAPVIFTQDSTGLLTFLSQVGITISVALIFSLLVSLTLIPFLTARVLKPKAMAESGTLIWIQDRYLRILRWTAIKRPYVTGFAILFLIVALTAAGAKVFKLGFDMDEGELVESLYVNYEFSDNLSYTETEKYVDRVEEFLFAHKEELGVKTVYSYYADNRAATSIYFKDKYLGQKNLKRIRKQMHERLPLMAGVKLHLGDEEGERGGGATTVRVTLFGEDIDLLAELAEEVKRRLQIMGSLQDIRTSIETGRDEIKISLNRELASRYGVSPDMVGGIMNLTFRGMPLRRFQARDHEIPMSLELSPQDKLTLYNLENMLVGFNNDREITLGSLAEFSVQKGPSIISREHQKTALSVQGLYDGDDSKKIL